MEEDEVNSAHGDAAVGEIKYRLEEAQGRAANPGQPGGPGGIDKREISWQRAAFVEQDFDACFGLHNP